MADQIPHLPMLIGGTWRHGAPEVPIHDPYRGDVVAFAPESSAADLDAALSAAVSAKAHAAALPGYERAAMLRRAATLVRDQADEIGTIMARESGKAIKDAAAEVLRSQDTLNLAAEEAVRIEGEQVPLDSSAMGAGRLAFLLRFPVGVVAAITPFNAPFNLACHKLAPAIAAGNSVVLKAPPQTPWTVTRLVEIFVAAGVPPGMVNLLHGRAVGPALVRDPRVDFISFTGSSRAGAEVKAASGLRRVALELGGAGATLVCADADLAVAAATCARNAMRLAGQSCISVQNVYVARSVLDQFITHLMPAVQALKLGDPLHPDTDVGTLIDQVAARRVEAWVEEARGAGARVLCGGRRDGAAYQPTVLFDVAPSMRVVCEEVFGPVLNVLPFDHLEQAFDAINASAYGLHCGIFTRALEPAFAAVRRLRVGGVIVNGSNTWRTDQLAYGGVKASGEGREGPRYAIRDMTEQRLVVFNL
jgi:acyl-CoA reductase-like NAD-dependent aldehyde dehydrogenase